MATRAIFRVEREADRNPNANLRDHVLIVFPDDPANPGHVQIWTPFDEHNEASIRWVQDKTRPASQAVIDYLKPIYERRTGSTLTVAKRRSRTRSNRDRASRKRRGPEDRGMKLARMIAKFQPTGRRMNPEEKLEWRLGRLRWALERDGIPYRDAFREVLVDQMIKEDHRADAARYRRAYGSSRDRRHGGR